MAAGDPVLELYRRVGRGLHAYARSLSGRADLAEDLVQEAFLRYLQGGRSPTDEAGPSFLYGIVRNLGLDLARKSAVHDKHEPEVARALADKLAASTGPEEVLTALAFAELQQLPLDQREVVVLKVFGGLTFDEIGAVVRAPAATAASRYRYALEKLSTRLTARQEAR